MSEQVATNDKENEVSNEVKGAETPTTKKRRRGINNDVRTTTRLRFHERDANPKFMLFLGHLESVEVQWITVGAETTGLPSFTGEAIPKLNFTFASNHPNEADKRYAYHTLTAIESNVDTIEGGNQEWKVTNNFTFIKHIIEVFLLKGKPMPEEMMDMLELPFEDYKFDENNAIEYVEVPVEEVIKGWQILFENAAKIINEGLKGKPIFKDASGKFIPIWMKLLRYNKRMDKSKQFKWYPVVGGSQTGELGFSAFSRGNCIEIYDASKQQPNLVVDPSKESITPKEIAKAPNMAPAMPGMPGAPGMTMSGLGDMNGMGGMPPMGGSGAFNAAGSADDLPF
jgi:hypothetical protein